MVCRENFTERVLDTPLLYDLHADPGEIYPLDTKSPEYSTILEKIKTVRLCYGNSFHEDGISFSDEVRL